MKTRYKLGITDYKHRLKMLKNYQNLLRIYLGKKNNYYLCGFYQTLDPKKGDVCYGYYESRWLEFKGENLTSNQRSLKLFGTLIAQELINKDIVHNFTSKKIILDFGGRRKKLSFKPFLEGLGSKLTDNLKKNFRANLVFDRELEVQLPNFKKSKASKI